jgi:hypothetical protein
MDMGKITGFVWLNETNSSALNESRKYFSLNEQN